MILTIASGKGGTGKTLVSTSLALSVGGRETVQFLDCDVEEPNAHIFLKPDITDIRSVTIPVPKIDEAVCTHCGLCADVCNFNALAVLDTAVLTFPELCHGCGACTYLCPVHAITEEGRECGVLETGHAAGIAFTHGRLNIGEAMAPPVIRKVKEQALKDTLTIIDAPPGTSCPVVETVRDSDYCILVTEPTPFGLNDLKLAVETVRQLGVPCGVVLNRAGSGDEGVTAYCRQEGIPLLLRIPLDMEIARLYSRGITLAEGIPAWRQKFTAMYDSIREKMDERTRRSER